MTRRAGLAQLSVVLALWSHPALAQDNPALREAVRLAADGRGDEARRVVAAELARARPGEPAYVEALYWRARLTASGDSAERDLRRVAIEFPTSRWADDALLHLAQLAMTAGNPVSAFALAGRLRSDYPDSDLRASAAFWAGRAAFDLSDTRAACALLDTARTEGADEIEFVNRVDYYRGRCAAAGAAATPSGQPTPTPGGAPAGAPPTAPGVSPPRDSARPAQPQPARAAAEYAVQVAAVRTATEERRVLDMLRRAGYTGRSVTGADGLRRIRVGAYATEREARAAITALRRVVGGRPFVVRDR